MEVEPQEGELGALVSSPEFARMVDRFQASTGLKLQVFDLEAHPLTPVEDYPRYCRLLQERKACPLYHDPDFLKRNEEGMAVCKSGVGHFIAPVRNEKLAAADKVVHHNITGWGTVTIQHGAVVDFNADYGRNGKYGFHYWDWAKPLDARFCNWALPRLPSLARPAGFWGMSASAPTPASRCPGTSS